MHLKTPWKWSWSSTLLYLNSIPREACYITKWYSSYDWHLFFVAVTVTCSGTVILSSVLFHLGRTGGNCTRGLSYLCCISHASDILSVIWVVEYLLHSKKIHLLGYVCAPCFVLYFLWHVLAVLEPSSRKYSLKNYTWYVDKHFH